MIAGVNVLDKQPHPSTVPERVGPPADCRRQGGTAWLATSALASLAAYQDGFEIQLFTNR